MGINPGGMVVIFPQRSMILKTPPPGNDLGSSTAYLNCLIHQHGKLTLELSFEGIALIFITQLVQFIANHRNKNNVQST